MAAILAPEPSLLRQNRETSMRRVLLLLPLSILAGCYYPYGPYYDGGYYAYPRPYPPPPPSYAPPPQPSYQSSYPQQNYAPGGQYGSQGYYSPPSAAPDAGQPPQPGYQSYGQPTNLAPPAQYQSQPAYPPPPTPYQSQPQDYYSQQPGVAAPAANCGTPDAPRACN